MADLPSILGGLAQGFVDFGKGAVDMFGTGGAAIGDLIESARTGKVTTKNQDDFRKWLYQTDSTKDAAAKGLGTALNGVQTVLDYIPGVNVLTRNPLGNAAQGALGGLADEFKTYGEDYDLGRAGQRAAVSGAAAAASGSLADALKGSSNALLSSNTLQGLARGATGGAITGGGYAAIDGGDVLEAAKQGAGMGALIGGATGAFQDFKPAKTYDVALTDDERAARIANAQKQLDDLGPIRLFTDDPDELAKRARVHELQDTIKAYQSGYDTLQDYNDALAARRANRQPSLTREEYEAKMQQRIRDLGGNYEVTPEKQAQFDRLQKVNPMRDDYHTGIRAPQDIATLQEAINNAKDIDPAYKAMLQKALADDSVTVYSSYPIEEGVFTTPIKQMAQDYAGPGNQVYSKTISPNDIAWIDDQEGNYIPRLQQLETTLSNADMAVNNPRYLTDENGNPRTFYHGSPNKNITEFDINQAGKNTSSGEHALYFTDSPEVADEFSYERLPSDSMFVDNRGAKGRVYPVNLAMDNPLDLSNLSDKQIEELWQYASPLGKLDGKEKFIKNMKAFRDYGNDQLIKTNLDLDKLANSQYDGFTARMYPNQDNQAREYAVFDNSKVKMLEDVLANDDMAVNSPKLTPEQEAFFKDSVIRDENGNLMPMYHGTRSNFTVFGDNAPYDTSNSHASVGNWFTPTKEGAKNFAESIWYGDGEPRVMETYLNVKNPKIYESADNSKAVEALTKELREMELNSSKLSDTELYSKNIYDASMAQRMLEQEGRDTTIKWLSGKGYGDEKAAKLVDEIAGLNEQAAKKKDLLDRLSELEYSDAYQRFKTDLYKVDGQTAEDANVGGIGMALNDRGSIKKYVDKLKSEGYDGIIIKGTKYDADVMGGPNDQYVVFDSNQIKDINNLRPTSDVDIMAEMIPEDIDLGRTLSRQDLSVNSAKIAPGQLGLFDDMPTQTPKTGTRQTSLFDQPDNPYLDYYGADIDATPLAPEAPVNPYAPVNGEVTQAMRDRAADILGNWKKNGVPENELYNAIDPETLPAAIKGAKSLDVDNLKNVTKNIFGVDDIKKADINKVIEYAYSDSPNLVNYYSSYIKSESPKSGIYKKIQKEAYEVANARMMDEMTQRLLDSSVIDSSNLRELRRYSPADHATRSGYTAAADEVLSERLGIAPGNTPKYNGRQDVRNAYGRYSHPALSAGGDLAIFERKMSSPEDAVSTMAHERLHSFQGEAESRNQARYNQEVIDAYNDLHNELKDHYKDWGETAKRYGSKGTAYWQRTDEQEARMLQTYLENKGYAQAEQMQNKYRKGEWGDEINPAFDKFFDKLRDLSKRGVALPALAALFGGGAYMASQENDKEKEVK